MIIKRIRLYEVLNFVLSLLILSGCSSSTKRSFDKYPIPTQPYFEQYHTAENTRFVLWAPSADKVRLRLYKHANDSICTATHEMRLGEYGQWYCLVKGEQQGMYYTFEVCHRHKWLGETPGLAAQGVSTNGKRAVVVDIGQTDPSGWKKDIKPTFKGLDNVIIYELDIRDFTSDSTSGIMHKGSYLGLAERGTYTSGRNVSGLEHLRNLGITHVQLLPSFDFSSINESKLNISQDDLEYNPQNYFVPEGTYSTNPSNPTNRILEFKEMVMSLHRAGIRVIINVAFNQTLNIENSNYQRVEPDYFYRRKPDGSYANASDCRNEVASERTMARKLMIDNVLYWAKEYHIDGFHFDFMGKHDQETMRQLYAALQKYDPTILVYGEGSTVESPQLPEGQAAMKAYISQMPGIATYCDEMCDAIRGPWNSNEQGGFLVGVPQCEPSICFGLVGAITHPQINYGQVNYSNKSWASNPTQTISYVSCHDGLCLADRIRQTLPKDANIEERIRLQKLAQTLVLTSQGIPSIYNGDEIMREKKEIHHSQNAPDSINVIPWENKNKYLDIFEYIRDLISLRKAHPMFHMGISGKVMTRFNILQAADNVIVFRLDGRYLNDTWNTAYVAFNSNRETRTVTIPSGQYQAAVQDGKVFLSGKTYAYRDKMVIAPQSALILYE